MEHRCIVVSLVVGALIAYGQQNQNGPNRPAPAGRVRAPSKSASSKNASSENASPKPEPVQPKYLTGSLNLTQTTLGTDFVGHDIVAVTTAVRDSPALQPKSEFESTAEFRTRLQSFVDRPLLADVMPTGNFAFVIEDSMFTTPLTYDADSTALVVSLMSRAIEFRLEKDKLRLDTLLVRRVTGDRDSYIGSNVFGATAEVKKIRMNEYGVAFQQNSWMFKPTLFLSRFQYRLPMEPDAARLLKPKAKLLLVCRLIEPWYRSNFTFHDPTVNEPWEHIVDENFLQIVPEQLWLFDSQTGAVVQKISGTSAAP